MKSCMEGYNFRRTHFDKLQDYIQSGSVLELNDEEQRYLEVLYLLNNLRRKYGKENAIAFIQRPPYNIQYRRSRQMFDEAINLFYLEDGIEKQAHRNMLFEQLLAAAAVVMKTAKTPKEMEVYGNLIVQANKIKGLDVPEPPKVPEALYNKPIKIYSLDPKQISLPAVDRNALAERIDAMDDISALEKKRIRQEAGVETVDFIELLDDQENKIEPEKG